MNEEEHSRKSNPNPLTTTLLILILLVALLVLCELTALLYERGECRIRPNSNDKVFIPIPDRSEDDVDYGTPEIDGVPIATPAGNPDRLQLESSKAKTEFRANVDRLKKKGDEDSASTLIKRDEFARRRLKLLKAIEKAETPMERKKLIEKFK